jgi:hypothetical protein
MRAKRFLLARSVLPAWGEPTPPRLALGGNGKGGSNSLLPQAILSFPISSQTQSHQDAVAACRSFFCSQLLCQSTAARRLASIRTLR